MMYFLLYSFVIIVLLNEFKPSNGFHPSFKLTSIVSTKNHVLTKSSLFDSPSSTSSPEANLLFSKSGEVESPLTKRINTLWKFSRPHTIKGSTLAIISLYLYATPFSLWITKDFIVSILYTLVSVLLTNLYVTGVNQLTDIDIDKINKPYLPLASGEFTLQEGRFIVISSFLISFIMASFTFWPLKYAIYGALAFGSMYSLPPFRLKRFPLLAALCILLVRGVFANIGFFLQAVCSVQHIHDIDMLKQVLQNKNMIYIGFFFAIYGGVIALMKDIPDIAGDIKNNIATFSTKLGAKKMLMTSGSILVLLLGSTSLGILYQSLFKNPNQDPLHIAISLIGLVIAITLGKKMPSVDIENPKDIFTFYMFIWNIFYTCYILLPFLQ